MALYNKLDTTSIYLYFFNVFVWLTYHSSLITYLCIGNEMEISFLLSWKFCIDVWKSDWNSNVEFCLLRWWAIVNEYWDLSQIFECLEEQHLEFFQNTYWKLSNPIHYYIKNSSILLQIEVFIYSFVNSSLGLLVFIPHWKQHNLTWDCYLLL